MRPPSAVARPWPYIGVLIVLAAVVLFATRGGSEHHVRAAFPEAVNVPDGALVQAAGVTVGHAKDIHLEDGQAIVRLDLDDEVWPLPKGTTAKIRAASLSGNVNRRIELILGPRNAPAIPDGGVVGAAATQPVELDDVFNTFNGQARGDLGGTVRNIAGALDGQRDNLGRGVTALGPALEQAGGLMSDLRASGRALSSLLHHGDRVTRVLAARRQRVAETLTLADATFSTFAQRSREMQRMLSELPPTLSRVTTTTTRLRPTLVRLTALLDTLAPGARRLPAFADVATPTLTLLRSVAGDGDRLVRDATTAAPAITKLLRNGRPFVNKLTPIVKQSTTIAHCLRPYAPEVAGLLSNWGSWTANYDANSNLGKIFVDTTLAGDLADTPDIKSTALSKLGVTYAMLRPPGWIGGKPDYMPECGVGKPGVDPATDWEDKP